MQRCKELSRKTRRGWKAKDGRRRQKRGQRFSTPSRQQPVEDGETQLSSGKTCSELGIPYLSFNRKIKCCWGNTSHVNFWTFGHLYFWKYTITLHSYGYNFTSLYKYATKNANLTVQQTSIKHLCFLIWNEKPRVSLLMNTFFLKGWTRTAAQGGKLSLDLHPADEYTHQHTSYAWKDRINPPRVTP